jgi:hypothetical protein
MNPLQSKPHLAAIRDVLTIYIHAASEVDEPDHLSLIEDVKEELDRQLEEYSPADIKDLFDDSI